MFDLEQWKKDWEANKEAWALNAAQEGPCYSEHAAQRCRNVERLLLLDLAQQLARLPTTPADIFDRPQLVQLQEAARMVGS